MRVSDVMTQASVTESPDDTLRSAAEEMRRQQTGSLLVIDGGALAGIITERDVLRAIARGLDPERTPVKEVMTSEVCTVSPDATLRVAAREMALRWVRHLPVLDGGGVVGMVSMRDVTGVFSALSKEPEAAELELDQLVREQRLARIEHGDLD